MRVHKSAFAGTLESSDCMVSITPDEKDSVTFEIDSIVFNQYGNAILKAAQDTVKKFDLTGAHVKIQDMGAFDCVIEARVETAVLRAMKEEAK